MPNNEWDDAVGTVIHQQTQDTATQVRNNVAAAVDTNPDAEAGFRHLANFTGVPIETARGNADVLRQQAATQQMDAGKLAQDFPHTANFLTDLDNTRIVHDDVPGTAAVEQAVKGLPPPPAKAAAPNVDPQPETKGFVDSLLNSPYTLVQGFAGSYNKAAGSLNLVLGAVPTLYDKAASLITGRQNTAASDWWFRNMVDPLVQRQGYFEPDRNAGISEKAFHIIGGLAGTLSQIMATGTGSTPVATAADSTIPQVLSNAVEHGSTSMAFPSLSEAVNTGRQVYGQTGDATAAARAAQMQYVTSTMGGIVPLNAPGNLTSRLATGFLSGTATSETSRQLMNAVMPDSLQQPFSAEDMIMGGLAGSIMGGVMGPRAEPNYHDAIRQTYIDATRAEAAQKSGEMVAALGQVSAASKLRERDPQAFRDFVQQVTDDGHLSEVYVDANELANALNQSGVTQADLAAKLPEVAEQLHEAIQTKGDVRIPVADYATHIAGGPVDQALLPHLKAEPDGMTYQEGQAYYQQQAEVMKSQADKIMAAKQADDAHQEQSQKVYDGMLEQLNQVGRFPEHVNKAYAALTRDFYVTTANRMGITPAELVNRYPLQVRADQMVGAKTLDQPLQDEVLDADKPLSQQDYAVRYLLKPEIKRLRAEAWQRGATEFDPDQADARVTGRQLLDIITKRLGSEQDARDYLKALGISDVRSAEGEHKPFPTLMFQPAYHGSPYHFDKFSLDHMGSGEGNQAYGWGLYFAGNKAVAEWYRDALATSKTTLNGQVVTPATPKFSAIVSIAARGYDAALADAERALASGFVNKEAAQKEIDDIKSLKGEKIASEKKGSLYTVDIPDDEHMLLWDKPLSEQPEIAAKIRKLLESDAVEQRALDDFGVGTRKELADLILQPDHAGDYVYGSLQDVFGSDREASINLNLEGIEGIKYLDSSSRSADTSNENHNYVIFNDNAVKILDHYNQDKRGAISFGDNITERPSVITLFKQADLSTFLHENGHFFLEVMHDIARRPDAPEAIKQDMGTLLNWFGVKDLDTWSDMSLEQKREFHEQFARGFEAYLMEGRAPSVEAAGMFARFRSWLVSVYQSLASLNVQLTDEVRSVMDRMLASEAAIHQAEQVRGYRPLFESAQAAGMTPEQFADYQKLGTNATQDAITDLDRRSLRDMQWLSNAKSKALKALQKEAASKRKAVREQVTKEVMAEPVNQARTWLKKGEMTDAKGNLVKAEKGFRLSTEALKEMYPEGMLGRPDLDKLRGMTSKEGLHPDLVAEMFGFESGGDLVNALINGENPKDKIEGLTDQRMLEEHGELVDPASIERAAEAAIHNEARARFVATELKALAEANEVRQQVGTNRKGHKVTVNLLAKAAKEAAEAAIAAKRVRDIRPTQYAAAEARAAKAADKALAAGDLKAAAVEKRAQLLNNRLTKVAADAIEEVRKGVDYLKKFDKPGVRENIDLEYRDQIDALLDRYDLRKSVSGAALDKREALTAFVERMAAQGYEPQIPEKLLNEASRMHYKDMPVEDFRGLVDAVKSIEHLGRLKTRLLDLQEMRELKELAAEAQAVTDKLPQREPESNRGLTGIEAKWLNVKSAGRSMQAALLKMEQMFDWLDNRNPNGVFNRVVFRRIADAGVKEADLQAKVKAEIDKLLDSHLADVTREKGKIYVADGLIDGLTGKPQKFTKKEMLALAGNVGNESNLAKLVTGEKWDEAKVWDFLHQNMNKADWDFVAGLGRALEALWPEKLAMSRRLGNTNPEKIQPRAFDTPHGRYDGWYWPMVYDPARAQDVAERGARAGDALFENIYTRANTDTGRMNTRNENYARPLLLSLDVIPRVIKDEIHDIAYREAIIDTDKFLSFGPVRDAIQNALSPEHYAQLRPWLQSIANDRKVDMQALKWFDRLAHGARTRATIVGLGYRISTMLVHGSSAAMESIAELGPRWMAAGLADFANPVQWTANRDFVFERSGEMRNRMNEVDRDVREHLREIDLRLMDTTTGTAARGVDILKARAYWGIAMLDMASALPTWMGAYHKAMAPESKGGLGMAEKDAVYFADKTVRNAHGGTGVKDLAAVQRGPEFFKLFTMFYTFWNHNVNRLMDTARLAKELPDTFRNGAPGEFRGDLGTVIVRTLIYTMGVQVMHHMLHPSKDDQGETNWLGWAAKELTAAAFAGVPVLRDLSAHYLTGKDYSATPAAGMVAAFGNSGTDAMHAALGEEVSDKWLKHTVTTAGYAFGLPLGQASSSIQFLWDVADGKQTPQELADWWHGILYGDMKPH